MITPSSGVPNIKTDGSAVLTLYSKKFNKRFWETDALVIATTSEYFKDLKKGDQVEITGAPTVTWKAYENGMNLGTPNRQKLTKISVVIDQAQFFNEALTDVDAELSHLMLETEYIDTAVKDGQAVVNTEFFTAMQDAAHASNKGATAGKTSKSFNLGTTAAPVAVNTSTVVKFITQLRAVIREQKVADQEIWVFIPPWMHDLLINSEIKSALAMGDSTSVLRSGFIGKLAGKLSLFESTYLPTYTTGALSASNPNLVLAGTKEAIAYTMRLNKVEKVRIGNFETLLQGLMVWGRKCVKPELLINAWAYKAAEA